MSSQQSNYGPNAMSLGGLLYESLSLMSSYEMKMQQAELSFLEDQAEAQTGIVKNFLNVSIDAAKESADALQDEAIGNLVGGAAGLGGAIFSITSLYRSDSETQELFNDAKSFQKELNTSSPSQLEIQDTQEENELQTLNSDQVPSKIRDWASGDKSKLEGFANSGDKDLNIAAVNQLKTSRSSADYDTVSKNVSDHIDNLQKRLDSFQTKLGQQVQASNQLTQAMSTTSQGGAEVWKAKETQLSQSDSARAQVIQQEIQQWNSSEAQTLQAAQEFGQAALTVAAAFGQITQTRA